MTYSALYVSWGAIWDSALVHANQIVSDFALLSSAKRTVSLFFCSGQLTHFNSLDAIVTNTLLVLLYWKNLLRKRSDIELINPRCLF